MRLFWETFQPSTALFVLFGLGIVVIVLRQRRAGAWLTGIAAALFAIIVLLPVSSFLVVTLETRFPAPRLPDKVDGIIMLGGALNSHTTERWGRPQVNHHAERIIEAMVLARRYPDAVLLISGGHYDPEERLPEADIARSLMKELGQPEGRAVFEDKSRTTWENGVLSRALVHPRKGQTWLLVTSAQHMPRAVGVFRQLDWDVIPYPVDYMSDGEVRWAFDSVGYRLAAFDAVTREWMAMIVYHLKGRTPAFFPG